MKRILVPTNFDDSSEWAFRLASSLSRQHSARIYVLRVVRTHGGAYFDKHGEIVQDGGHDVEKYRREKEEQTQKLKEWADSINKEAYQVVLYGGIADTILKTIEKYKVGMVILGNKFVKEEPHRFFGELTSFLTRKTTAPILSLKSNIIADGIKDIVFASEFDGKLSFFDGLQDLQHYSNGIVHMLRVNTPKSSMSEEEAHRNMDYFARVNMIKNYTKNVHNTKEKSHEAGVLEWVSKHPCNVLAVKNSKKSGPSPLFRPKLSKAYFSDLHISTLIYND